MIRNIRPFLSHFRMFAVPLCFACSATATNIAAASTASQVTLLEISLNPTIGNFVFIRISPVPALASCANNGYWQYSLNLSTSSMANQEYAALLAAQMAGKTVTISGTGTCNDFYNVESANALNVQS